MLVPIPRLEDFGLSPSTGFLPSEPPLQRLPHPAYDRWERVIDHFQPLLLSKRLRVVIDHLAILPVSHLEVEAEWRRAYSILAFMAHGYIWGGENPADILPASITYPLLQVSAHLGLPPVATYSALCLWNFKPIFLSDGLDLDNLTTLTTFTGSIDEQWFYLVSIAMEARGGPAISLMLDAMQAARDDDLTSVVSSLRSLAEIIDDLGSLLMRMYESCDPHIFYHRIRPYLAGSKNMRDTGLPSGVRYEDGSADPAWRQYCGGSNAQSSLIQFFDIVLGIEHRTTGNKSKDISSLQNEPDAALARRNNFIQEMRQYMPAQHREFLRTVEVVANIREYVDAHRSNVQLCVAYDACLAMLRALRDKHIQMVSRYVIVKSRESKAEYLQIPRNADLTAGEQETQSSAPVEKTEAGKKIRGTGGTALIPFLRQARDETTEPAVGAWARKLMSGSKRSQADTELEAESRLFSTSPISPVHSRSQDSTIVGLAGSWKIEDSGGGLCLY